METAHGSVTATNPKMGTFPAMASPFQEHFTHWQVYSFLGVSSPAFPTKVYRNFKSSMDQTLGLQDIE
jgi:hypothetical protein